MLRQIAARSAQRRLQRRVDDAAELMSGNSVRILDVGAADGAPLRWRPYAPLLDYVAVEPDSRSQATLMHSKDESFASKHVLTHALWSTPQSLTLHLCRKPLASSVYPPNTEFLRQFPDAERFDVVGRTELTATTVDLVAKLIGHTFDALKLDVQGAELEVLRGASASLRDALFVEAEVEFVPLYLNQPLFSDITAELASHGLIFNEFLSLYRWHPRQLDGTGQLVFGDALYARDPEEIAGADGLLVRRYATLAAMYSRGDLLTRLAQHMSVGPLAASVRSLAESISKTTAQQQQRLSLASRVLRLWDRNSQGHLLH